MRKPSVSRRDGLSTYVVCLEVLVKQFGNQMQANDFVRVVDQTPAGLSDLLDPR